MIIALLIQYDGSAYHGWQIQKDPETIQGHLERALHKVLGQQIGLVGSGRTDSGVHALGQVAHFEVETSGIPVGNLWKALNRELPDDIRLIASTEANDKFHSRFAANQRGYLYQIATHLNVLHRHTQWHVRYPLDVSKLQQLSSLIIGEHDFSSFCYAGTETENMICTISSASWDANAEGILYFKVSADRFLHHMVRMLVGSMIEVARGKWEIDHFSDLLNSPNRKSHTITAPANGLALMQVSYPDTLQPAWQHGEDELV
ncbi:MAG: tRNA pseudouridine(38-40) synthase TruA [Candidatus Marinimicrobia bacterium]|jgi:tRNA pseudouridine38-40 synthase|nr:tRNA pseudouridine(38-40) synthase TruA [Candidatus Neomarinimicrobiota bacterium]MBT3630836.1 tRNA pseudouridine(38-40) synthase TruA [Candidatus Neomarinimicrobiota bacterium]MBT3825210.1 tRNA pseudouridine(38-40) synthase TruA [Candidatus Neomarinimicrobiota bacterium]MBT4132558.1 tRNA pseudouridine(38-40) synthase TruA [Candidatus Neomarinimicrobiota bacterium]MBT4296439.1 tRNA pseudouridine(38-40) synthase TruA [Candidatus Neomarinimicrobiota bacterium]